MAYDPGSGGLARLPLLHDELWLEILQRVPEADVLENCMLVNRNWRNLSVERTATEAILETAEKCIGCGARVGFSRHLRGYALATLSIRVVPLGCSHKR